MASSKGVAAAAIAAVSLTISGWPAASAKTIYKAVDESGEVTYSDTPPSGIVGAHRMAVQPSLSPEELDQAAASRDRLRRSADFEGRYAAKKPPVAEVRDVERRLREARERLERYEVVQDEDWTGVQSGKRGFKPSYHARIDGAKAEIADLEAELKSLQGGR